MAADEDDNDDVLDADDGFPLIIGVDRYRR